MSAETLELRARLRLDRFALDVDERLELDGVTAVFGPSGGGKTTLLRLIAGFETPERGRIALGRELWFDAERGLNSPPHRRSVGMMFQDARLFPHLTVAGNLDFADRRSRREGIDFRRDDLIESFDLGPLLTRRPASLSGGERQRVALARTLLTRPRLLLLDEPLSALDAARKMEILPYLERLQQRFAVPTLYVTHSLDEVRQLARRTLALAEGRVRAYGPTAEIVERLDLDALAGPFEAGSLAEAEVRGHDPRLQLTELDVCGQRLTVPRIEGAAEGERVRVTIHARDVAVALERPRRASIRNVLQARVSEVSADERTAFADVLLELDGARLRARLTRAAVEDLDLRAGMHVYALIKSVSLERLLV